MSKRSSFKRRPLDDYPTIDPRAVRRLLPHIRHARTFAEPCAGDGVLVRHLESFGYRCAYANDIASGHDALVEREFGGADLIITNPPWTRAILHPMILHFQTIAETWLLFDADWAHTQQARPFLPTCKFIVSVGRLIWIEGTTTTGKDNVAWHCFTQDHCGGPLFINREYEPGLFE